VSMYCSVGIPFPRWCWLST